MEDAVIDELRAFPVYSADHIIPCQYGVPHLARRNIRTHAQSITRSRTPIHLIPNPSASNLPLECSILSNRVHVSSPPSPSSVLRFSAIASAFEVKAEVPEPETSSPVSRPRSSISPYREEDNLEVCSVSSASLVFV